MASCFGRLKTRMENAKETLKDLIRDLERKRNSRIFSLVHCGSHHICGPTFASVWKLRDSIQGIDTLEILMHSPGGHPSIAYQVMKFFRRTCKRVNVIVPLQAKSAATLMCFGADMIYMGEFAELGPMDVQINDPLERGSAPFSPLDEFKSMEFLREYAVELLDYFTLLFIRQSGMSIKEAIHESIPCVSGMMRPLYERIDPLEVGGHRRALAIGEEYSTRLLKLVGNPQWQPIVERLVWKYPSHDFAIDIDEALELGLPISALPREQDKLLVNAIMELEQDESCVYGFVPSEADKNTAPLPKRKREPAGVRKRPNGAAASA